MNDANRPARVEIIGTRVACTTGFKDSWRDVATWAASQFRLRFGDQVHVEYFDLFDPACPPLPAGAQLPVVIVAGEVVSSGGKVAMPLIRRRLEALGLTPVGR